jgi:hypothetical protein
MAVAVTAFLASLPDGTSVLVHEGDEVPGGSELVARDTDQVLFARPATPAKVARSKPVRK